MVAENSIHFVEKCLCKLKKREELSETEYSRLVITTDKMLEMIKDIASEDYIELLAYKPTCKSFRKCNSQNKNYITMLLTVYKNKID